MPWYLYLALKQLFPSGRRFPFFTAISILGVALGVMVLIIVASVMAGFGHEIKRMIVETEGEVQVKTRGLINDVPDVVRKITETPGVVAATPYVAGPVMVMSEGHPGFPVFRGIDLTTVDQVVNLAKYIRIGSLADLDDDSVVLSYQVAKALGAQVGSEVEIVSPLALEKFKTNEFFVPRSFRVVGIFEVGHQQIDSSLVYGTLRTAQDLYGLG